MMFLSCRQEGKNMSFNEHMLNFTVGPVMSDKKVLEVAGISSPYFRTTEFSDIMIQNEQMMLENLNAPNDSKCVFLTTSGTGAMESVVMNVLNKSDKVLVINGGGFGKRFLELAQLHGLDTTEIKVEFGCQIKSEQLEKFDNNGYTALLVNMHETSSGNLYDMDLIASFCIRNDILLIVDASSSFIADELDMTALNAAVVLTGSQKALAVQPGISIIAMNHAAIERVEKNPEKCMYLSLKEALLNSKRGQTPFTPAVTTLLQINVRLKEIKNNGGIIEERKKIVNRATTFREFISELPFEFVPENMSNAITCLSPLTIKATDIISIMKDEYNIWLCPNGGDLKEKVFRVGHIGNISDDDMKVLMNAFDDLNKRYIL